MADVSVRFGRRRSPIEESRGFIEQIETINKLQIENNRLARIISRLKSELRRYIRDPADIDKMINEHLTLLGYKEADNGTEGD